MMLRPAHALLITLLALAAPARAAAPAATEPCRAVEAQGETFTVCTIDLRKQRLRLFWLQDDGKPYGALGTLAEKQGGRLAFAMNAGMYDKDQAPVGLYVENGHELKRVSTADGPGNFHLKPNGIFWLKGERAGVVDTSRYLRAKIRPDFATQSGPMLVIDGQIHPKIAADGPSQKIRNGVGVPGDGHVAIFAISERPVTFGAFARLFRDDLGCRNALFLDGSVSSLYAPNLGRTDISRPLGPLVGALPR
ncbi:prepilin-type processing-associated H-X9-DG domain-containing protein [Methylobacterium sp. UNC300MFChir4.1]|uniref:phosphodiester glycosidase family protein n=1 Tax=Methylobacterium TaxID=407 RepID=UPI0008B516E2|nr:MULTISPECIES: phosphodiester glycosidase family protein [unclassified Methylobacterium]SEO94786.1 prepilin-type processing-associated H-X9-DG domain-containing protein [Methylobacterium sp. UNC300MFChir4.1]SFE69401.1 prepilin-type processing-associated H-X9-DG domain-containing protein [Methylobacterium sp. 13MFTsu3.1M2]SFT05959.1 prepilin-type processing-associated H-X9-DG domain-containing protein [Methylobacterium sp. yr668]